MTLAINVRLLFIGGLTRPDRLLDEKIIYLIIATYLSIAQTDVDEEYQVQ